MSPALLSLYPALATHRGVRRPTNEDSAGYLYPSTLDELNRYGAVFAVADGVGGRTNGEGASEMTVKLLLRMYYTSDPALPIEERLVGVIQSVNAVVHQQLNPSATTLTVAVIHQERLVVASVGDSAAYVLSSGQIRKLTDDHVIVDTVTQKSKLTRAIGHKPTVTVDTVVGQLQAGDKLLLVTDGITRYLSDDQIRQIITSYQPHRGVEKLITEANGRGGADNVTACLIEIGAAFPGTAQLLEHVQHWSVFVDIPDTLPPADPDQPNTEFAAPAYTPDVPVVRRAAVDGPLNITDEQLARMNAPQRPPVSSGRSALYNGGVIVLLLLASGMVFAFQQGWFNGLIAAASPQPVPSAAVTLSPTGPPIPETLSNGTVLRTPEPTAPLQEGAELVFEGAASTRIRIDSEVPAFSLDPGTLYVVDDVFEREGETWIQLSEPRSGQSGWIREGDLPAYHAP